MHLPMGFPMKFDCRIFDYFLCWIHRQTKELSGPRSVLCSLILKDCRQKKLHDSQNYFIICPLPLSLSPNWHHHNLYLPSTMTNNDHHICTNHGFPSPRRNRFLADMGRDPLALEGDLVALEHFFPHVPSCLQAFCVGVACSVLGLGYEIIHWFPTNLQGVLPDLFKQSNGM